MHGSDWNTYRAEQINDESISVYNTKIGYISMLCTIPDEIVKFEIS